MSEHKINTSVSNHGGSKEFYEYYAKESLSNEAITRFERLRDLVLRTKETETNYNGSDALDIIDIGCGAGTLSMLFAEKGHNVHGLDVNESLISLAINRANESGYNVDFQLGTATNLPWGDNVADICLAPELLEHVPEWDKCLDEFSRILRPGGILFLSTTNKLCPKQQEYTLPLYSWYPGFIKRYCERLAVTSHPEFVNYATYPAVNWFSYYTLRKEMAGRGFRSLSRFDVMDASEKGRIGRMLLWAIRNIPGMSFIAQIMSSYTQIVSIKLH